MRLFADTNIVASAVAALRAEGHDVVYSGEWSADPGDAALVAQARDDARILITKDHDIGALVFKLEQGKFVRVNTAGVRVTD